MTKTYSSLLFLLILICSKSLYAQYPVYLKAGFHLPDFKYASPYRNNDELQKTNPIPSPYIAYTKLIDDYSFELQSDLLAITNFHKLKENADHKELNLFYLQIEYALLGRFNVHKELFANIGPYINISIPLRSKENYAWNFLDHEIFSFDFGIKAGMDYQISDLLAITAEYAKGIVKLNYEDYFIPNNHLPHSVKVGIRLYVTN